MHEMIKPRFLSDTVAIQILLMNDHKKSFTLTKQFAESTLLTFLTLNHCLLFLFQLFTTLNSLLFGTCQLSFLWFKEIKEFWLLANSMNVHNAFLVKKKHTHKTTQKTHNNWNKQYIATYFFLVHRNCFLLLYIPMLHANIS